jgi:hypothetical protein
MNVGHPGGGAALWPRASGHGIEAWQLFLELDPLDGAELSGVRRSGLLSRLAARERDETLGLAYFDVPSLVN